jgi:hypothetical protein
VQHHNILLEDPDSYLIKNNYYINAIMQVKAGDE